MNKTENMDRLEALRAQANEMEDALALVGHDAPPIRRNVEDALAALRAFRDALYKAEEALDGVK